MMIQFDIDNIVLPSMLIFFFFLLIHLKFDLYRFLIRYRRFHGLRRHARI